MTIDFTRFGLTLQRLARPARATAAAPLDEPVIGQSDTGRAITWSAPSLEHAGSVLILAASGTGKTILAASALVAEYVAATRRPLAEQPAIFIVDPKNDLVEATLQCLAATAPEALARVTFLDPFPVGGFPFNLRHLALGATPLDIRAQQIALLAAETATATGSQRHLGHGARQLDCLQNVILGALASEHQSANILWALDALTTPHGMRLLASVTASERARQFLLTANLSDELRASSAARLRAALGATDSLERLVSAGSCIQFGELLAPGMITLLALGTPPGGL